MDQPQVIRLNHAADPGRCADQERRPQQRTQEQTEGEERDIRKGAAGPAGGESRQGGTDDQDRKGV
jgi:hypothetical protein